MSDSGSLWVVAGIGPVRAWLSPKASYQRCPSACARGNAAVALVAIARRVLSGLVSIRDAKAYEQSGLLGQRVSSLPKGSVLGCPPASLIALPAESPLVRIRQRSLSSHMSLGFTLPLRGCFRGAGSELGERFRRASWQESIRARLRAARVRSTRCYLKQSLNNSSAVRSSWNGLRRSGAVVR